MPELAGLAAARDRWPAQRSGGMRRRALLARSVLYDPPMPLLDEPFAALDAQLREDMHAELLATVARTGHGVLFVTHDIGECLVPADRIVVLGGRPLRIMEELSLPWAGLGRDLKRCGNRRNAWRWNGTCAARCAQPTLPCGPSAGRRHYHDRGSRWHSAGRPPADRDPRAAGVADRRLPAAVGICR
jgi:energy-coupling factor transporter ATP-binding protein EcfA2